MSQQIITNSASNYNQKKAIVFSIYNRDGIKSAVQYLDDCHDNGDIDIKGYVGLKAEIKFYNRYRKEFTLDPVWDYGIKCDFVGNINGTNNVRLDVTTNLMFKDELALFNLQVDSGRIYKYVKVNPDDGKIVKIVDYFNSSAKNAHNRYNLGIFLPGDNDKYNPYLVVYSIDIERSYDDVRYVDTITDFYLPTVNTVVAELPDEMEDYEIGYEVDKYCATVAKLLNNEYGIRVDAFGQYDYHINDLDCKYIRICWRHPALREYIDDAYYDDLSCVF